MKDSSVPNSRMVALGINTWHPLWNVIFSFSSSISCKPLAKELLASNCFYRIAHGAKHRAVQVNASSLLGINTTDNIGTILDSLLGMKAEISHITVNISAFLSGSERREKTYDPCFPVKPAKHKPH